MFQMKTTFNERRPKMEEYIKYQKCNILATTGLNFPKFETLAYVPKANLTNVSNEDDLQMEDDLKYQK
jgi:hypothetical protein